MRLKKGKWYVCIKSWGDDDWCKFGEGDLLQCESDDYMVDPYGYVHRLSESEADNIFREATKTESNIAKATEVDLRAAMGYPRIPICRATNVGTAKVFPSASSGTLDGERLCQGVGKHSTLVV